MAVRGLDRPSYLLALIFATGIHLPSFGDPPSDCWTWENRTAENPAPRFGHAMAFDARRQVAVLFGGRNSQGAALGDTWEWDGMEWHLRSSSGPSPRHDHAMAYDAERGVVVMFGGHESSDLTNANLGDTWESNGVEWALRSTNGPAARYLHAMAYDSVRKVTVLFSGFPAGADTWEWDGQEWVFRGNGPLLSRSGHTMAYDRMRDVVVMFGGFRSSGRLAETWEWDGAGWTQRNVTGPAARADAVLAFDTFRGVSVLHGGVTGVSGSPVFPDTWEWNGEHWTRVALTGPVGRSDAAMAFDESRGIAVLFGGITSPVGPPFAGLADTWAWDGANWLLRDAKPSPMGPFGRDVPPRDRARGSGMRWRSTLFGSARSCSAVGMVPRCRRPGSGMGCLGFCITRQHQPLRISSPWPSTAFVAFPCTSTARPTL